MAVFEKNSGYVSYEESHCPIFHCLHLLHSKKSKYFILFCSITKFPQQGSQPCRLMTAFNSGKSIPIYFINHACSAVLLISLPVFLKNPPVQQHYKHCFLWKTHKYDCLHTTQKCSNEGGYHPPIYNHPVLPCKAEWIKKKNLELTGISINFAL